MSVVLKAQNGAALTPRETVAYLDRYVIGQKAAKRAIAIALRNRWRRMQLPVELGEEVVQKNMLLIGPTGCGKTALAKRMAKIVGAPFLKVEATKFTEVGYMGRDVDQIGRDLLEVAVNQTKSRMKADVAAKAALEAEKKLLKILVGESPAEETWKRFEEKLRAGVLDSQEVEIQVQDNGNSMPAFEIPGMPGAQMGMLNISDFLGKNFGGRTKKIKTTVADARTILINEASDRLLNKETMVKEAIRSAEANGIVFIDEIDKICGRENRAGGDVSREGVQRDLLPFLEGTTISTKYGPLKTDHILFIASGAFHVAKPSDLLPELQGRLPTRVELSPLKKEDFVQILSHTEASLVQQAKALLETEGVTLDFTDDGVEEIACLAAEVNAAVEDIGARRLQTLLEKLLETISFDADQSAGQTFVIDASYVQKTVGHLAKSADLSRFIL